MHIYACACGNGVEVAGAWWERWGCASEGGDRKSLFLLLPASVFERGSLTEPGVHDLGRLASHQAQGILLFTSQG